MAKVWVGVDIGKSHHHVAAVDRDGRLVFSRRVANDEGDITAVIAEVAAAGRPVCWAVDVTTGLAALLLTMLWRRHTEVRYVSGTVAFHMAAATAGESKTRASRASVIADTARMRPDLPVLAPTDNLLAALQVLTGHRADLVGQRVAALFRLRELLTAISPALERATDLTRQGPIMVLACWQTPAAIRAAGAHRIETLLRRGRIRNAAEVAEHMLAAARSQTVVLPGQQAAAGVVAQLAADILALGRRIDALDEAIAEQLRQHPLAETITSLPGMGKLLAAELLVHTSNLREYTSPHRLAAHAGLAPVVHDSGTVTGNERRPRRYHRRLRRVFWISALTAIRVCPASRAYYDKKRAEGKHHRQAMLALARRRVNVLWALIRDGKPYRPAALPLPLPLPAAI